MHITPNADVVAHWSAAYIPETDLFFLSAEQLDVLATCQPALVMPLDEFFKHATYSNIHYVNSYEYWNIQHASYVVVAHKTWIEQLDAQTQATILAAQLACNRGMTVPLAFFDTPPAVPANYIHNAHIVLQRAMWEQLNEATKAQLLQAIVHEWWDKGDCQPIPPTCPPHLCDVANTFGTQQGANCFAAVLYAITEGTIPNILHEWIYEQTFLHTLHTWAYAPVASSSVQAGDVLVWHDADGTLQHAAYALSETLFFNKHGQTMFNAWKLLSKTQLDAEWSLPIRIYRKGECI